jgi:hypothetical protein
MNGMRQKLLNLLLIGSLLTLAAQAAASAEKVARQTRDAAGLAAADSARYRAMTERNVEAVRSALADELVYVHSSSTRQTKEEHLYDLAHGRANYARIIVKEQMPAVYGNTGVINGIAEFTTGVGEQTGSFTLRYLDVYVWRQGRWQMVAFHCTRMPEGGASAPPGGPRGATPPGAANAGPAPPGQ